MNPRAKSPAQWTLLLLARFYIVFLSPFFGGACKFYPSCSNYAMEAVARHGARRGFALAMKRLLRCRPFTKGGFDPVPDVTAVESGANRVLAAAPRPESALFAENSRNEPLARDRALMPGQARGEAQ